MNFEYPRNLLGSVNVEISVYIKCRICCWKRMNVPQSQVACAGGDIFGRNEYKHCKE